MAASKIPIEIDVNTGDVKFATDQVLTLREQIRLLQDEIERVGPGDKQDALIGKLNETRDEFDKTTLKSQEFLGALSTLPGPVGDFTGALDFSINSMKQFTAFSFKDVKKQLGDVADDFKGIGKAILDNTGITKAYSALNNVLAKSFVKVGVAEDAAAASARGLSVALSAIGIGLIIGALALLIANWEKITDAITGATDASKALEEAQSDVTKAITDFNIKLINVKNSIQQAKDGVISKEKALKDYNDQLGDSIGYAGDLDEAERLLAANTDIVIKSIELRTQAQVLYAKSAEASAKIISGEGIETSWWQDLSNAVLSGGNNFSFMALQAQSMAKNYGDLQQKSDALKDAANELTKEAIENDKKLQGSREDTRDTEKAAADEILAARKRLNDQLLSLQQENALAEIQDEEQRALKRLEFQKENAKKALNEEKGNSDVKKKILGEMEKQFQKQQEDIRDEYAQKREDQAKKIRDFEISMMTDEEKQALASLDAQYQDKVDFINKEYTDEVARFEALKNLRAQYEMEQDKIIQDSNAKRLSDMNNALSQELGQFDKNTQMKLTQILFGHELERKAIKQANDVAMKAEDDRYKMIMDTLKTQLDQKLITEDQYNQQSLNATIEMNVAKQTIEQQTRDLQSQSNMELAGSLSNLSSAIGNVIAGMDEQSAAAKTLTKIQQGLALASTMVALADSLAGLGKDIKKGFPTNIIAVISTLGLMVTAFSQFKALTGKGVKDMSGSGGGDGKGGQNLGKNYARGGMIGGLPHARGGTIIEAEQGESILTREATSMFGPMLSMMNQMGGGNPISPNLTVSSYDNPKTVQPSREDMIIKTYVVEQELTNSQQRQARLKDLSTL